MSRSRTAAELIAATNYSFLRGASHPAEMVARAHYLGLAGIGIADRNTVAGVVRAHTAWRELGGAASGLRLAVGARLVFADGTPDVGLLWTAYQRNVDEQFLPVQKRLDALDLLSQWTSPIGSSVWGIAHGVKKGNVLAEDLF